jgi:hypothetical protein
MLGNSFDFMGTIVSTIKKGSKGITFDVKQVLPNGLVSKHRVRLFFEAAIRFEETGLHEGDQIFIHDAINYQKDGISYLRATKLDQLINMSMRKESLDLGTENVERFI